MPSSPFRFRLACILTAIFAGILAACMPADSTMPPRSVALVMSATHAEYRPALADSIRRELNALARDAKHPGDATVHVVASATAPLLTRDLVPMRGRQVEHAPAERDRKINQAIDELTHQMSGMAADRPGLDLLTLLDRASELPNTDLEVLSSGVATEAPLDLRIIGLTVNATAVVDSIQEQGLLPNLSGRHVTFHNLGVVAGTQPRLAPANRAAVERLWLSICERAGASCTAATDAVTANAPIASLPVPVVPVASSLTEDGCPVWASLSDEVLHFAPNDAVLPTEADAVLRSVVDAVRRCNLQVIDIAGHIADTGGDDDPTDLSGQRAHAVASRLVALGLPANTLGTVNGHGSNQPVVSNFTNGRFDEAKARLNRRVELTYYRAGSR